MMVSSSGPGSFTLTLDRPTLGRAGLPVQVVSFRAVMANAYASELCTHEVSEHLLEFPPTVPFSLDQNIHRGAGSLRNHHR